MFREKYFQTNNYNYFHTSIRTKLELDFLMARLGNSFRKRI